MTTATVAVKTTQPLPTNPNDGSIGLGTFRYGHEPGFIRSQSWTMARQRCIRQLSVQLCLRWQVAVPSASPCNQAPGACFIGVEACRDSPDVRINLALLHARTSSSMLSSDGGLSMHF